MLRTVGDSHGSGESWQWYQYADIFLICCYVFIFYFLKLKLVEIETRCVVSLVGESLNSLFLYLCMLTISI